MSKYRRYDKYGNSKYDWIKAIAVLLLIGFIFVAIVVAKGM